MLGTAADVDWRLVFTVGIPTFAVILGWFFSHWLTEKRELASRKREARLKALEKAYMRLATSINRDQTEQTGRKIEAFASEIQLYGTPRQISIMANLARDFYTPNTTVNFNTILTDLRNTIRRELKLEPIPGSIWWLRLSSATKDDSTQQPDNPNSIQHKTTS